MPSANFALLTVLRVFKIAAGMFFPSRAGIIAIGIVSAIVMISPATAEIHRLNRDEMKLFNRISSNAGQKRETLTLDPILCKVARQRGADMARRHYFGHVNPNGQGPNFLVRRAGFVLPMGYDRSLSANNIESIGMSVGTPREMISLWLQSSGHRPHVLGEVSFYQKQTAVGVGIYHSSQAPYYKYFVFISAPPAAAPLASAIILKDPKGVTISSTQ